MPLHTIFVAFGPCLMMSLGAVALIVVYRTLSRVPHALLWSAAFAVSALQWAGAAFHLLEGQDVSVDRAGQVIGTVATMLFAEGFRTRARRIDPDARRLLAGIAAIVAISFALHATAATLAAGLFNAVCAGLLLRAVPHALARHRDPSPSEYAAAGMLGAIAMLMIMQTVVALAAWRGIAVSTDLAMAQAIVLLPLAAAVGLFTMLLIASDFSRELRRLIHTDPLTGVLNRTGFEHAAGKAILRDRPVALAMADIDRFKTINDRFGHATGDVVLACVASHLAQAMGRDDVVARFGGEEFVLLLAEADGPAAIARIDPIRHALTTACSTGAADLHVTASFGVAQRRAGETLLALIERADAALYRSKSDGRDRTTLAEALLS